VNESIETWVANLIRGHLDMLATSTAARACELIPIYRTMDPPQLHAAFANLYQAIAATVGEADPAPLRSHLEQHIPQRLHQGMAVTDLLHLSVVLQDELERLVTQQAAADAIPPDPAIRLLQAIQTRVRMIVSGINLQVLATPG
jgi:hypothetical protein